MGHFGSIYPSCNYTFISALTRHVVISHHPKKSKIQSIVGIIVCKSVQKAGIIFPTYVYPKAVILTNKKHDIPWCSTPSGDSEGLEPGVDPRSATCRPSEFGVGRSNHVPSRKSKPPVTRKTWDTFQVLNCLKWFYDNPPHNWVV